MLGEAAREKSLSYWKVESPTYNFSVSLSTSLSQLLGIRFLDMDIALLGVLVTIQLGTVGAGALIGIVLVNNYRYYRKLLWLLFGSINRIGWSLLILIITVPRGIGVPLFYLIVAISQISGAIAGIAAGDVGGDLVKRDKATKFFGSLNSLNNLAALASLIISIALFVILGNSSLEAYVILYILSLISAIISTAFLAMIKDDPDIIIHFKQQQRARELGMLDILSQIRLYRELLVSKEAKWYIAIVVLYTAFTNLPASVWNYYLIYNMGGDEVWITSKTATIYIVKTIMLNVWPHIIRVLGARRVFIASLILISPYPLIFMIARSLLTQIVIDAFSNTWWAAWDLLTGLYNLYLLPRDLRPIALSLIILTTNLSASISSAVGAMISSYMAHGPEITFIFSALARVSVALIAIKRLPPLDLRV